MWHNGIWIHSPVTSIGVVHSTWPSRAMWHMHAPTFNKWHKKNNKNKKVALHILTHSAMWGCGWTSLVDCINDIIHDIRKRNVTIRSEIWAMIRFLGFRDIKEWVILWRLILRSLGCIWTHQIPNSLTFTDFGSKSRISQSQCEGRQLCVQSLFVILVSQLLILFTEYGH